MTVLREHEYGTIADLTQEILRQQQTKFDYVTGGEIVSVTRADWATIASAS